VGSTFTDGTQVETNGQTKGDRQMIVKWNNFQRKIDEKLRI